MPVEVLNTLFAYGDQVVSRHASSEKYGIYILGADGGPAPYHAFVHVNHKLPRTTNAELRIVWMRFAPKYSNDQDGMIEVFSGVLFGGLEFAAGAKIPGMKMYLGDPTERRFAASFSASINKLAVDTLHSAVKGSWLHVDLLSVRRR